MTDCSIVADLRRSEDQVVTPHRAVAHGYMDRLHEEIREVGTRVGRRRPVVQYHWGLLVGAVVAGLVELTPAPVDDNLTVPLLAGTAMHLLGVGA